MTLYNQTSSVGIGIYQKHDKYDNKKSKLTEIMMHLSGLIYVLHIYT